jgi:hypothetical protein
MWRQDTDDSNSPRTITHSWEASAAGMLKVNWDVAIAQGENRMGVGIIIRDEKGNVIAATSKPVMATHNPATAEALAALRVVGFCREVGAFDINLEGGPVGVGSGQLTSLAKRYGVERGRKLREERKKKWRAVGRIKEREVKRKKEERENIVV